MSNALTVSIYDGASRINDQDLAHVSGIAFTTLYPGGLFGAASVFVPRDVVKTWQVRPGQRLVIRNGLMTVWEGKIVNVGKQLSSDGQGIPIQAAGYWQAALGTRRWRKAWADSRIGEDAWVWQQTPSGVLKPELFTFDRYNRIRITPKPTALNAWEYSYLKYTAPPGQTLKRVTATGTLSESGGAYKFGFYDLASSTWQWSLEADGTGNCSVTFATPLSNLAIVFQSLGSQTPPANGLAYGQLTNIVLYTEHSDINPAEIAKDIRAKCTDLSSDENLIGSNTLSLVPFHTDEIGRWPNLAEILTHACRFGDTNYIAWAAGVRASDLASDGKPPLFLERYPVLTDYDYVVSVTDPNLVPPLAIDQDISELYNWVVVTYRNDQGIDVDITPDDDATLKDISSISAWGQRDYHLRVETASATTAAVMGRTFLASRKDPLWRVNGEIQLTGYVKSKSGAKIPTSQVQAGKRIKISNFIQDLSGAGLTFLINGTEYTDATQAVSLLVGRVDRADILLAQLASGL